MIKDKFITEEQIAVHRHTVFGCTNVASDIVLPCELSVARYAADETYSEVEQLNGQPVLFNAKLDEWVQTQTPYLVTRDGKANIAEGLLTNVGGDYIWQRIVGTTGTAFDAATSFLAVGTSTNAAVVGDVTLVAQTGNRKGMDSGWPKRGVADLGAGNERRIQFKATFGSSDGNGAWQEFGVFNASTGGGSSPTGTLLLDRLVSNQGTKVTAQIWVLTLTLTVS